MRSSIWMIIGAAIGLGLGVLGGEALGRHIRSDNLPFFWALGGLVGACAGSAIALVVKWIRGEGTGSAGKTSSGDLHDAGE